MLFTAPLFAHIEVFGCTPVLVQIVWVYCALIMQLKNTSLASTIAVADLFYQGTIITARLAARYTIVAVICFIALFPLTLAA